MLNDRDYVFASSFLRASDGRGTPGERLARFGEANGKGALRAAVAECYGIADSGDGVYEAVICDAVEKMRSSLPDFSVFYPLLYKYDCNNIKTSIKCAVSGADPEGLMFSCGTVAPDVIIQCAKKSSFAALPMRSMSRAADEALETFRKTGEVRAIDLMLDAACFEDMKECAELGGVELIKDIVRLRADGVNTLGCMRIGASGMPSAAASALMKRAFVPGGDIPMAAFISAEGGCADKEAIVRRIPTASLSSASVREALSADSFAAAEKIFDEAVLRLADKYRFKSFGPEIAVRFLVLRETEMTNCRIIEASMRMKGSTVKERMRKAYV